VAGGSEAAAGATALDRFPHTIGRMMYRTPLRLLALSLGPILAGCDDSTGPDLVECGRPGEFALLAPQQVRQGEVVALDAGVCNRDGQVAPASGTVAWSLARPSDGLVDQAGNFVGYAAGETVQVVAAAGERADTARIVVAARGLSGALTVLGMGFSENRFTSDLWVSGDYAYTGTWGCLEGGACGNRLNVWNVREPSRPLLTDSVIVDARTVNDVKVSADGRLAVITQEGALAGGNGITLLSLADPAHPRVITRYTQRLENGVHNVWIEGNHLYVVEDGASANGGLHILDISNPAAPVEVAHFYAGSSFVHDVYVRDGLAFVSHWDAGLVILDVGNGVRGGSPSRPVEVSRILTSGGQTHNAWYWPEAGYVFVGEEDFTAGSPGRVHVVNLKNLTAPVEVASYFLPGDPPHNFWLDESAGILFVGWYSNGVRAIDVTGTLLGSLERQGREYAAARPDGPRGGANMWAPQLHGGRMFASDLANGLWAFSFQANR
jgi:hypothetical protein